MDGVGNGNCRHEDETVGSTCSSVVPPLFGCELAGKRKWRNCWSVAVPGRNECSVDRSGGGARVWRIGKRPRTKDGAGTRFESGFRATNCLHGRIVQAVHRTGELGTGWTHFDAILEDLELGGTVRDDRAEREEMESSGEPVQFMYFEKGNWVEFSAEANAAAWNSFQAGHSTCEITVQNRVYMLNFLEMVQENKRTGYIRSLAWINDDWVIKLPANPTAGPCGSREEPGVSRCDNQVNRYHGKWRDGAADSLSSLMLETNGGLGCESVPLWTRTDHAPPALSVDDTSRDSNHAFSDDDLTQHRLGGLVSSNWEADPMDSKFFVKGVGLIGLGMIGKPPDVENTSGFSSQRLVPLKKGDSEYEIVEKKFMHGIGRVASDTIITGIHRDTSAGAAARQEAFVRQTALVEKTRGNANLRFGWHGTSKKAVEGIFLHGFGQPKTSKNGSTYGVGVYLAVENQAFVSALYADNDENGEQHVVLCQVIAGASEVVKPGSEQFHPSTEHFDTGVDDINSPKRLIVWSTHMNTHILPLYVVSFKLPPKWHRMIAGLCGKQKGSSTAYHQLPAKRSFTIKKACGVVEALHNKTYACMNPGQGPKSAFIRFPLLLPLLQLFLTSEQRLELKNCHAKFEAGEMSREMLVKEIQKMVGRDRLIHAIQMCRGFQGGQATSGVNAQ
ncbi:inactive poly [ADP-ribose] polymerase RCD1 [Physcomitrium patens]|uniref:Uncharacterized protein n=2 Tax=Physcomitrium patens TaxID=3218 RepID=A0A2K1IDC3_PHYPA|nr:inactive poly [ADP-ribose] polymerase RCD1-like [Physcomitrium patens]PNR27275.1 hypothetical protein PHYPA_029427 [Physcomitrium patens]|eukprot:XP_024365368.1 inactive poly [ADP-ribose] polymerase RCD1-like [Physcomitrella patens]